MHPFLERMYLAAKLDPQFYDDLVTRTDLHRQSIWVMAIYVMSSSMGFLGRGGGKAVNTYLVTALIAWYVWAFTVYFIGRRMIKTDTPVDRYAVMRAMGYATAPGVMGLLGAIPNMTLPVWVLISVWMIAAASFGTQRSFRQASIRPTAILCLSAWVPATIVQWLFILVSLHIFWKN
jgi:hypothetical protein